MFRTLSFAISSRISLCVAQGIKPLEDFPWELVSLPLTERCLHRRERPRGPAADTERREGLIRQAVAPSGFRWQVLRMGEELAGRLLPSLCQRLAFTFS